MTDHAVLTPARRDPFAASMFSASPTTRWSTPSAWGSGSPRPADRGGHGARQRRPRPARSGARAATRVGELDGTGRAEDDLAYFRDEREFRNVHLVEQERGGFGVRDGPAAVVLRLPVRAVRRAARLDRRRSSRAWRARRSRRSTTTATTRRSGWCAWGTAPPSRTRRMQAALDARRALPRRAVRGRRRVRGRCRRAVRACCPSSLRHGGRRPGSRGSSTEATLALPDGARVALARRPRRRPLAPDGLPPRRDAAHRPLAPGRDVVSAVTTRSACGAGDRGHPGPRGAGRHHRGPRHPARRRGRRGAPARRRDDHARRTPAARRWRPSNAASSTRPAAAGCTCEVQLRLSPAWTTDWMTERGRQRLREFGIAPPAVRAAGLAEGGPGGPDAPAPAGGLPAVRQHGHRGGRPLRLDRVQGAAPLPRVPASPSTSSRPSDVDCSPPRAPARRRAQFHPLTVTGVERLTDDAVADHLRRARRACATTTASSPAST